MFIRRSRFKKVSLVFKRHLLLNCFFMRKSTLILSEPKKNKFSFVPEHGSCKIFLFGHNRNLVFNTRKIDTCICMFLQTELV